MNKYHMIPIPENVRKSAAIGNDLRDSGFMGGTSTGWNRGVQLANEDTISLKDLADMRTWFSRHGPDASKATSYPGYIRWLKDDKPMVYNGREYRGAVSWLLWGGSAAYLWLKTPEIRELLKEHFPKRKEAWPGNSLDPIDRLYI